MVSAPKELLRFWGNEWIKPISGTLFWSEAYSINCVLHRSKQMVVRRGKVQAIRRESLNIPTTVFQIVFSRSCNMWPSVVMMADYVLVSGQIFWSFFVDWYLQPNQLCSVQVPCDLLKWFQPLIIQIILLIPCRYGYSSLALIWLVGRASHMTFCAWGYRNVSIFYNQ